MFAFKNIFFFITNTNICKQGHLDVELNEAGRQQAAAVSCVHCILSFLYTNQDLSYIASLFIYEFVTVKFYDGGG